MYTEVDAVRSSEEHGESSEEERDSTLSQIGDDDKIVSDAGALVAVKKGRGKNKKVSVTDLTMQDY